MGAFEQVDLLRREFGKRWIFAPSMRTKYGKAQLVEITARQIGGKRKLRFSNAAELAERIREIERGSNPSADERGAAEERPA